MAAPVNRRAFLACGVSFAALGAAAPAAAMDASLWTEDWRHMPTPVTGDNLTYFTTAEAAMVDALADRLIPADDLSPGGKDAGVTIYIDRQLAGPFGRDQGLYMQPPFADGFPGQGPQSATTPAQRYRKTLAALADYCQAAYMGKDFGSLPVAEQDKIITAMEAGTLQLAGMNAKAFFQLLWQNVKEGFFADPIYGGNRGMVGWKLIGFPGARYDYRDWIDRHNEPYPNGPVGLADHPDWQQQNTGS
jgi:gluconate 2-dehydrogenase gamma chain